MKKPLSLFIVSLVGALFSAAAPAQTYPTRPVRIMVGFLPGGSTDIMVRLVTPGLTEAFQQQFVIHH